MDSIDFSLFSKDYGNLTKEIRLENNEIIKDSSGCKMAHGGVKKQSVSNLLDFNKVITTLTSQQAIAIGTSNFDNVRVGLKGEEANGTISRTKDYISFKSQNTLCLFDYDPEKGKPSLSIDEVRSQLINILPELAACDMLILGSTSSGVYPDDKPIPETVNGGCHIYIIVDDGTMIPKIGKLLGLRSWLKGYGRFDVSKSGALLPRVLFDEAVFSPERLIFEANPILGSGLKQLPRASKHWPGQACVLNTANINDLSSDDESTIEGLKAAAKALKQPEANLIRDHHNKSELTRLINLGVSQSAAHEQIKNANGGKLTGDCPLYVEEVGLITAADIIRWPDRFHESQCVDPGESLDAYAPYRAKAYNNEGGWRIHSFRHGGIVYEVCRVDIEVNSDDPNRMFKQMERVLNTGVLPNVFVYAGALVIIGNNGALRVITDISADAIFKQQMTFYTKKQIKGEWVRVKAQIPVIVLKGFLQKGSWKIPKLTAIVTCPYVCDGRVIQEEGYSRESGLYLTRRFNLRVLELAPRNIAITALNHLKVIMKDFPFETDTDQAVALAAMLTAVMRPTLPTAPLIAASANTPATGKTLLMSGIASLTNGLEPSVHGYKHNEEEFAKVLMAALMQCEPHLLIDNVKLGVVLEGDSLCAVLSSPNYAGRELGFSKIKHVSTRVLMLATGNNLRVGSDLTRRTLMIKLDAKMERPETRVFDRTFLEICLTDRDAILSSILTILSAYHGAGRPKANNLRLGSFETFCDEICAPLVWLGELDPVEGLSKADADAGIGGLSELLSLWKVEINDEKKTAAELLDNSCCPTVSEFFHMEFSDSVGKYGHSTVNPRKVSNYLGKYASRVVDGMRLVRAGTKHKTILWGLEYI